MASWLSGLVEPAAVTAGDTDPERLQVSIAISLKRIADALARLDTRQAFPLKEAQTAPASPTPGVIRCTECQDGMHPHWSADLKSTVKCWICSAEPKVPF